jgi:hypothetical protein
MTGPDPALRRLTDAQLKARVDRTVRAFATARGHTRSLHRQEAERLRDEVAQRLAQRSPAPTADERIRAPLAGVLGD